MNRSRRRLVCILLFLWTHTASAQTQPAAAPGDSLEVYLVSMGPGDEIWEKFGHNAIIIADRATGAEAAYNYGIFDFNQPNFIGRFILGRMLYSMDAFQAGPMVQSYIDADRDVILQELNLTAQQKARLRDLLEWNRLPENREYLYDYFRANCSTKIRDALDQPGVLDGQIKRKLQDISTGHTFRSHTRIGMADDPFIYAGLALSLGRRTDRVISAWQEAFIPMELAEELRTISWLDASGNAVPLIKSQRQLHRSSHIHLPATPPVWWPWYLLIGIVYSAALLICAILAKPRPRATPGTQGSSEKPRRSWLTLFRVMFAVLSALWSLLAGLAGCFLIFALTTDHVAAHANNNIILFTPLSLLLVVFAPSAVRKQRFIRGARIISAIALGCALIAVLLNAIPSLRQFNWELIALALPVHVSLAAALWKLPAVSQPSAPVRPGKTVIQGN
jgi:hypothetical protein